MNQELPDFSPPSFKVPAAGTHFPERLKQLEDYLGRYHQYTINYMTQVTELLNTGTQGYAHTSVASAASILIGAYLTHISGSVTIANINTSPGFSGEIGLIADDGFALIPGGNIFSSVSVVPGGFVELTYDPVAQLWYPISSNASGSVESVIIVTGTYTVGSTDVFVFADSTGGAFSVFLPLIATSGKFIEVKNIGSNLITLDGNGNLIDGMATQPISPATALAVVGDGTNWQVV